jgi:hypothetical protein
MSYLFFWLNFTLILVSPMSTYSSSTSSTSKPSLAFNGKSVSKRTKTAAERWAAGDDLDFVDSDTEDQHDISDEASQKSLALTSQASLTTFNTRAAAY